MLKVDQYDYIRIAHRIYQKKIREIARETGHSRNTVKKALQGEYEGYRPRQHQPYPVLGRYLQVIAYSELLRPLIPIDSGHPFRSNPAGHSEHSGHL